MFLKVKVSSFMGEIHGRDSWVCVRGGALAACNGAHLT